MMESREGKGYVWRGIGKGIKGEIRRIGEEKVRKGEEREIGNSGGENQE